MSPAFSCILHLATRQFRQRAKAGTGEAIMSQVSAGILGGLAVALTLGAVQLASGRDLATRADATGANTSGAGIGSSLTASSVNRAVKADRQSVQPSRAENRTVSIQVERLPATSIVIRIPEAYRLEARDGGTKLNSSRAPTGQVRRTIACEPVVSVLTEVAKQLQPGRCVT
jgi:hypothetical protein